MVQIMDLSVLPVTKTGPMAIDSGQRVAYLG